MATPTAETAEVQSVVCAVPDVSVKTMLPDAKIGPELGTTVAVKVSVATLFAVMVLFEPLSVSELAALGMVCGVDALLFWKFASPG